MSWQFLPIVVDLPWLCHLQSQAWLKNWKWDKSINVLESLAQSGLRDKSKHRQQKKTFVMEESDLIKMLKSSSVQMWNCYVLIFVNVKGTEKGQIVNTTYIRESKLLLNAYKDPYNTNNKNCFIYLSAHWKRTEKIIDTEENGRKGRRKSNEWVNGDELEEKKRRKWS